MTPVFFYSLFIDEALLRERGFHPNSHVIASVDNYGLRIGNRATLVPEPGQRSYGTVMALSDRELEALQGESSVAGFRPEAVTAHTLKNAVIPAWSTPSRRTGFLPKMVHFQGHPARLRGKPAFRGLYSPPGINGTKCVIPPGLPLFRPLHPKHHLSLCLIRCVMCRVSFSAAFVMVIMKAAILCFTTKR
jgi:hypothetical protein